MCFCTLVFFFCRVYFARLFFCITKLRAKKRPCSAVKSNSDFLAYACAERVDCSA